MVTVPQLSTEDNEKKTVILIIDFVILSVKLWNGDQTIIIRLQMFFAFRFVFPFLRIFGCSKIKKKIKFFEIFKNLCRICVQIPINMVVGHSFYSARTYVCERLIYSTYTLRTYRTMSDQLTIISSSDL